MTFHQLVDTAKSLMQKINDAGGTPYFADTFKYDRDMGWMVKADYAQEIEWQTFSYASHETRMTGYRNLNAVICYLKEEMDDIDEVLSNQVNYTDDTPDGSDILWAGYQDG